jgi:hypothetical protein
VGGIGLTEDTTVIGEQAPEPLTIAGIAARRAKAGKLVAGTAAYADSDMFKSPVCMGSLPRPSTPRMRERGRQDVADEPSQLDHIDQTNWESRG